MYIFTFFQIKSTFEGENEKKIAIFLGLFQEIRFQNMYLLKTDNF